MNLFILAVGTLVAVFLIEGVRSENEDELDEDVPPPDKDEEHPYVPQPGLSPLWPLPGTPRKWWAKSFGSARPWKSDNPQTHHKGVDIHAEQGAPVVAPTAGTLLKSTGWVGSGTRGLIFQSDGGPVLVFGAIAPGSFPDTFPVRVVRGEQIAKIGRYPGGNTMLHLELYRVGTKARVRWPWNTARPSALVNPHKYLLATTTS